MTYYDVNKTKILLQNKIGNIFNLNFVLTNKYKEAFEYLIYKSKLSEDEKRILYYVLNVEYTILNSININKLNITPENNSFHLVISLYNETKIFRALELLLCLSINLQNKNISRIHILYETSTDENANLNIITE